MNLQKKFEDWSTKVEEGEVGYEAVFFIAERDGFVYLSEEGKFAIQECAIIIWKDDKIVQSCFVDDKEQIEETTLSTAIVKEKPVPFAVITKMEEKMILIDNEKNGYPFGFNIEKKEKEKKKEKKKEKEKEKEDPKIDVLIFYCIDDIGRILVASSQSPEIRSFFYQIGKEPDAMKLLVKKIVKISQKEQKEEITETENKELISEGIVDGE